MASDSSDSDFISSDLLSQFPKFSCFLLSFPCEYVLSIIFNSNKYNSMTKKFWIEISDLFIYIATRTDIIRCVIFNGNQNIFTAGLDLIDHADLFIPEDNID